MTERTSTTRRRIGDRDRQGFPLPTSTQPESDEQPTADERATAPAEVAPGQGRRQIITGTNLRRNPNEIHTNVAGDAAGTGPEPGIGGSEGRRSIGDRSNPGPVPAGSTGSLAVAEPAPHQPTLDEPVTESQSAADDSPAADAPKAKRSKRPSRGRPAGKTVLVGSLMVVLLAATIFFGLKWRSQDNLNGLRSSALSSARADGVLLSSYDYRNLTGPGSAWANVEKNATQAFRKNFLSTSGTLGKLLSQYNATATGKVVSAGVASFSSSRAVVLLFIDQTVNNTVQKSASATQPLRTQVTLLRQSGRWLIDDLQVPK